MVSARTTLEVRPETKDRINAVKGPLTTDDLINLALDHLPAERVARLYEEWQRYALAALKKDPRTRNQFQPPPRKRHQRA
ncbi:MAG: hypothetical protein HYT80_01770 [Euryarchaeota archaeon]|nr:hypothetical protein [Euryarchaeota archaeon]